MVVHVIFSFFNFSECPSPGYYGENCSTPCPENCLDGVCDTVNGTCYDCIDGYSGSECSKGHYVKRYNNQK